MNSFSAVVRIISAVETKDIKGQSLTKCRCVHNTSYKDDSALFMTLNFWGSKAGAAERFLKEGNSVFVRGNLNVTTSKEGKVFIDLNADDFGFINSPHSDGAKKESKKGTKVEAVGVAVDEELPF